MEDKIKNVTIAHTIRNLHHLDRPCSIVLASLSLFRHKNALTNKIGGHEFCSFIEGCHCVGSRANMIVFRRSSFIPRRSRRSYEKP